MTSVYLTAIHSRLQLLLVRRWFLTASRCLMGKLLVAANTVRTDLAYTASALCEFIKTRYANHYATAKHVFQYINGTLRLGLVFRTSFNLVGYCHSNWAGHKAHKKLITGYGYKLRNTAITGKSTKQQIVELSSTEPEYMALLWLTQLLKHIGSK